MLRIPLLVAVLLVLPTGGKKPAQFMSHAPSATTAATLAFPHVRFPHFPKRKHEYEGQVALMKLRLRDLVRQEESWYAKNATYTKNNYKLGALGGDSTANNVVQVQVLFAGKKGWSATATHPDAPGKSCVMFVGDSEKLPLIPRTRAEGNEAVNEAVAVCDAK